MSFIKVENLSVSYSNSTVINNLNFTINNKDFISLIGSSGTGKSTVLKVLAKILHNYTGNIYVNSTELRNYNKSFAYMPQNHLLLPWKTILDNLCIPLIIQGNNKKQAKNLVNSYIEEFNLTNILNSFPHEISGGQKQRVALLRSILLQSNLLLLDEPFSQLDSITKLKLQKFLRYIYQKHSYTVFFVTHDIDEAILLSNKIYVMDKRGNIYKEYHIDLPYNRNESTILENQFLEFKKQVTESLLKCI